MKINKLDLVILVGGRGNRIIKYTKTLPKPLIKINNRNFLTYIINHYSKYCFENIYLLAGYKGSLIKSAFHNKIFNSIKIKCLVEKKRLGTAGALSQLKDKIKNDFVLMNGDSFADVDLSILFKKKLEKKFIIKMFLIKNKNYKSNNKLSNLSIKKNIIFTNGNYMNSGIYFIRNLFLKNIEKKNISLEDQILPELIRQNKVKGKIIKSEFIDIGTYKNLDYAKKKFFKKFIKPAAFLDRDGVINYDFGYVHSFRNFKLRNYVIKSIKYLNKKNYNIFIVTNQSGIARGYYTENDFLLFSKEIKKLFFRYGCFINDLKYSPYLKGVKIKKYNKNSSLRKPGNKMIKDLLTRWPVNFKKSFMIGDQPKDELCAVKSNLYFEFCNKNLLSQIKRILKN
jgi:D,D-heptose 1,7-bisphosphate phosphatase